MSPHQRYIVFEITDITLTSLTSPAKVLIVFFVCCLQNYCLYFFHFLEVLWLKILTWHWWCYLQNYWLHYFFTLPAKFLFVFFGIFFRLSYVTRSTVKCTWCYSVSGSRTPGKLVTDVLPTSISLICSIIRFSAFLLFFVFFKHEHNTLKT
jgi:hypothetical protein